MEIIKLDSITKKRKEIRGIISKFIALSTYLPMPALSRANTPKQPFFLKYFNIPLDTLNR